jgi:hypothetical protein
MLTQIGKCLLDPSEVSRHHARDSTRPWALLGIV